LKIPPLWRSPPNSAPRISSFQCNGMRPEFPCCVSPISPSRHDYNTDSNLILDGSCFLMSPRPLSHA
jgi:hypothetical protein